MRAASLLLISFIWIVVASAQPASRPRASFEARVAAVAATFEDWDKHSILGFKLLLVMPEFKALTSDSEYYVDECLAYISDPRHSRNQRRIAEYSMSGLPYDLWIDFANKVVDLHDSGRIDAADVAECLFPMPHLKNHLDNGFLDPRIVAIVYRVKAMRDLNPVDRGAFGYILKERARVLQSFGAIGGMN
jgi:hypothetical protein